jgi:chromosomal replication initiator protein
MSNLENNATLSSLSPLGFWDHATATLLRELSPQQFKTWIQPLKLNGLDESECLLTISARNRFKLDWTKKTFSDRFQELAQSYFGKPFTLLFVLDDGGSVSPSGALATPPTNRLLEANAAPSDYLQSAPEAELGESSAFELEDHSKLNPMLTFETFVTGKANQLARAASIQVAHNPGTSYNPMFLYGGVGLGKTHIIHDIAKKL